MALERLYTIPLRRESSKAPKWKRTRKAISATKIYVQKHMKCQEVRIGKYLNEEIWKNGRKNPPGKIQVKAVKDTHKIKDKDIDVVHVELPNAPVEKVEEKKEDTVKIKLPKLGRKKEEKKETLEKPDKEKQKVEPEQKQPTKEEEKLQKTKKVIAKPEKPTNEKKK